MKSSLDLAWVESQLAETPFAGRVHALAVTSSTNTLALEAAQAGAATGVWVADEQTAGRGRGGHQWHSAAGDGLYVSVLVRPRLFGADALKLSLAAALASAAAAHAAGFRINLRWPNDLMVEDRAGVEKKFGGILTESAMQGGDGALAYAAVGIGMNLNHAALPPDLRTTATSLRRVGGARVSRERMLVRLLVELSAEISLLGSGGHDLAARFERASTWVRGLGVHVDEDDGYTGVTDGLDPHGLLRVRLDDGSVRVVRHGGVRRLR